MIISMYIKGVFPKDATSPFNKKGTKVGLQR